MKKILLLIVLFLLVSTLMASERPELYGFAPAYVINVELLDSIQVSQKEKKSTEAKLELEIDEKGRLVSAVCSDSTKQFIADDIFALKEKLLFLPALLNGEEVASRLLLNVKYNNFLRKYEYTFPSDSSDIYNPEMFINMVEKNGIEFPTVKKFPAYFCDLQPSDTTLIYPLMIFKVELDKTGKLLNVIEDYSSFPEFTDQLKSAVMYAEFEPARIRGQAEACTAYLVISFFKELNYPTKIWSIGNIDSMLIMDRNRVKIFPAKIGLINKPFFRVLPGDILITNSFPAFIKDSLNILLRISDKALVSAKVINSPFRIKVDRELYFYFAQRKFYPAINFDGVPEKFSGDIQLVNIDELYIRILYKW